MINYDEFDKSGMDDLGRASIDFVESCMANEFEKIFGQINKNIEPTHLLNDVQWYEADYVTGVYPVLICEPIEDIPNNLVCLCPPFNKEKYL